MGAWIEICDDVDEAALSYVAPLVGAWIEIKVNACAARAYESLLSWERGLKSIVNDCLSSPVSAAPLVGAWIEINVKYYIKCIKRSLLSWERGLKFKYSSSYSHSSVSLLSWERGLK